MKREKLNQSDIERRLAKIESYIDHTVFPCLPLVLKGRELVVDKRILKKHLSKQISHSFSKLPSKKRKQLENKLLKQFNRAAAKLPFDPRELAHEAAEPKRTLLMAGPDKIAATADGLEKKGLAYAEWFSVRHALVTAGAHLEIIQPALNTGGFREVFTRDRYVVIGDTAYLPDPQKLMELRPATMSDREDYLGELRQVEKALQARGVKTVTVEGAWFEGGNVVRHSSSRTLFVGVAGNAWFSLESAQKLTAAINEAQGGEWVLMPVTLTNYSEMYHLDTGMSEELPRGEVMISPRVTDGETYEVICDLVGTENIIELSDDDAKNLATNMVNVGDTLIMTGCSEGLKRELMARGYEVITPADYGLDTFEFGRGGVHCMTNDVPRQVLKSQMPRA